MRKDEKGYLDLFAQGIRAELKANSDITDLIYRGVEKQNKRVDKIEEQTSVWRMIQKNPIVSIPLLLVGLAVLVAVVDLIGLVNIFK